MDSRSIDELKKEIEEKLDNDNNPSNRKLADAISLHMIMTTLVDDKISSIKQWVKWGMTTILGAIIVRYLLPAIL